ncbi:MAG: malonyl CoA-acyl carrier protein transacylase [Actinomycetota bacterium]|nr:MAG: malonyl CoA-acyl carrier protein transacylase [Actinomycetota bacterium]
MTGWRAAVTFPGQGSQFPGMADPWVAHEAGRTVLEAVSEALGRDVVEGCRDEAALAETDFVQPALLACGLAAFRVLEAEGVTFLGAAGHSLGELTALVAADALSLPDALQIVLVRGRAMAEAGRARPGAMCALLGVGPEEAARLCEEVRDGDVLVVANENSPQQVVLSGSLAAIERAERAAAERRIRAVRLKVAGAFHSPLMEPAVEPLGRAIDAATFRAPRIPVAENVTGELTADPGELRELLKRQVVSPVRWDRCVRSLVEAGAELLVEAGPGDVLTRLAKRAAPGVRAVAVGAPADARELAASA